MNWPVKKLILVLAMLAAGSLAAGCAQASNVKDAVANAAASDSATVSPPPTSPPASPPTPSSSPTPTPSAQPSAEPSTQSAAPAPAPSSQASSSANSVSDNPAFWLLIVLGAGLIGAVVYLAARRPGRSSTVTTGWRSRVADACAKGWALYDAISMAESPEELAPGAAGARWADIERRADDLNQTLYRLRETAPGEAEAARVSDVLTTLRGLRSAINAEHSPSEPGDSDPARVRSRMAFFESSLNALRRPTQYDG
jgi:hypothetical protein